MDHTEENTDIKRLRSFCVEVYIYTLYIFSSAYQKHVNKGRKECCIFLKSKHLTRMNSISFSNSIFFYQLKHCQLLTSNDFSRGTFTTLPILRWRHLKQESMPIFLKIGIFALCQERTMFIVSKFENTTWIGSQPVKLKPIPRGISSE